MLTAGTAFIMLGNKPLYIPRTPSHFQIFLKSFDIVSRSDEFMGTS